VHEVMEAEMGRRTVMRGGLLGAGTFLAASAVGPVAQARDTGYRGLVEPTPSL